MHINSNQNTPMGTISDNPSYMDILNQIRRLNSLINILPLNSKKKLKKELLAIEEQINDLRFEPDKFNQHYSDLGWIAYESMNSDLMKEVIKLAEDNKRDDGERLLLEYYADDNRIKYLLTRLKNRTGFTKKFKLLQKAYTDYKSGRFHSCIPIFLMIIDGVVDEVTKSNKGFFASEFDPNLWNSIVGHESGLAKIAKIYAKTRKRVNTEPITLPYRNGILHGKDINYDNDLVAAKCLATIFAVGDWVEQYESGKHIKPEPPKPKSILQQLKEFKESLVAFQKQHEENEKLKDEIEKWQPRRLSEQYINNINLNKTSCISNSPEEKLSQFMTFFSTKNYGKLHDIIERYHDKASKGQYIQEIKSYIGDLSLISYTIISIKDCVPCISEIEVRINIIDKSKEEITFTTKCRMIYKKDAFNATPLVSSNPDGRWFIMHFYINEIYNQYWATKIQSRQNTF